jgi:hypothetical protein
MNETLQRVAIYAGLGWALIAAGVQWNDMLFWCILVMFWVSNYLHRKDGYELGLSNGIEMFSDMTDAQRAELITLVKNIQQEVEEDTK